MVSNLSDQEHIQAYKHGLRSLSLTKILATKHLHSVDDLLDVVHEFIREGISVQSKRDHLEGGTMEGRSKHSFCLELNYRSVPYRLTFPIARPYSHNRGQGSLEHRD